MVLAVPSVLTTECYVSPPPTADDIINAAKRYRVVGKITDWEARFLLMSDHWLLQTDALNLCNKQVRKSRDWVNEHRGLERPNERIANP